MNQPNIHYKKSIKPIVNKPKVESYKAVEKRKKSESNVKITKGTQRVKALKYIGANEIIMQNPLTNEMEKVDAAYMKFEERDFNFDKIFSYYMFQAMGLMGSKKMNVMIWMMQNRNSDNMVIATTEKISKETKISLPIIKEVIKLLRQFDFLKRISNGCYQWSPNVIFKGGIKKRLAILWDYEKIDDNKKQRDLNQGGLLPEFQQEYKNISKDLESDLLDKKIQLQNLQMDLDKTKKRSDVEFESLGTYKSDEIAILECEIQQTESEIERIKIAKEYLQEKNPF